MDSLKKLEAALTANKKQQSDDVVLKLGGASSSSAPKPVLVGADVTLADICLAVSLLDALTEVVPVEGKDGVRASCPGVMAWLEFLLKQREFVAVLGAQNAAAQGKWCKANGALTFAPPARGSGGGSTASAAGGKAEGGKKKEKAAAPAASAAAPSGGGSGSAADQAALEAQKEKVRALKTAKAPKDEVTAAVVELKRLKALCGEA